MAAGTQSRKISTAERIFFGHPLRAFAAILAVASVSLVLQWLFAWVPDFVPSVLVFSLLAMFLPWAASLLYRWFNSLRSNLHNLLGIPDERAQEWFDQQRGFVFNSRALYLVATLLALGGVITTEIVGIPWEGFVRVVYFLFTILLFGMMGAVGWVYLSSLVFLYRLGQLEMSTTPFSEEKANVDKLHGIFLRMFLIGVVIYHLAAIGAWVSPGGQWLALHDPIIEIWIFPVAGVVTLYFLLTEYFVHRVMNVLRSMELSQMSKMINACFAEWQDNPSQDKAQELDNLLKWRDVIGGQPVWPLDFKSGFSIAVGLFLPTVKAILDLIPR